MPGSITLPQVVLDLEEEDRKKYEALQAPKSIVVRYGYMKMVAELPYDGTAKPGCGSKLVIRNRRGTELGEMLTTTCGNGGCGKNITRKQMLEYIDNSGGRDYPFSREGRVLRVATVEDMNQQATLESNKMPMIKFTKAVIAELNLNMKLVDIEQLLGGERIIFHYTSEQWIDFRELVKQLAAEFHNRIEMHQVNARDEARITADYEKCGQHCCCKQFLKVLKPVSMRSAKVQKATLDPTKISGRCGRLMCCLRYEDETYETLRKKLPRRNQLVKTEEGEGYVLDTQILTQLVLVRLNNGQPPAAFPLENITVLPGVYQPPRFPEGGPQGGAPGPGPGGPGGSGRGGPAPGAGAGPGARDRGPRRGNFANGGPAGNGVGSPRRDEPRRPQPGAPLEENEVESADGEVPLDPQMQDRQDDARPPSSTDDDASGGGAVAREGDGTGDRRPSTGPSGGGREGQSGGYRKFRDNRQGNGGPRPDRREGSRPANDATRGAPNAGTPGSVNAGGTNQGEDGGAGNDEQDGAPSSADGENGQPLNGQPSGDASGPAEGERRRRRRRRRRGRGGGGGGGGGSAGGPGGGGGGNNGGGNGPMGGPNSSSGGPANPGSA